MPTTVDATTTQCMCQQGARSLIECIESECYPVKLSGYRWHDTRPMLDPREHSPEVLDLNTELLDLALTAGLIARHPAPELRHLVHLLVCPL